MGATRIIPLGCARSNRKPPDERERERHLRLAREACKVSGRLWFPRISSCESFDELFAGLGGRLAILLERDAPEPLAECVRSAGASGVGEFTLLIGPEGGFDAGEGERARAAGARVCALGPLTLRIEHAASAAAAVALHAWWGGPGRT
jgi:16S rRNA (uracil1498-N3)-methyltransferase